MFLKSPLEGPVQYVGFTCKTISFREKALSSDNQAEATALVEGLVRGGRLRGGEQWMWVQLRVPSPPGLALCCPSVSILWHCRRIPHLIQASGFVGS